MDSPFVPLHASTPFKQAEIRKSFAVLPFNLENSETQSTVHLDASLLAQSDSLHDSLDSNQSNSDIPLSVNQYLEQRSLLTVSQRISDPPTLKPIFNNQQYKVVFDLNNSNTMANLGNGA